MGDKNNEKKKLSPPKTGTPKVKKEPVRIVDEKLVEKSKKAHEELATLRERRARYDEAEAKTREERQKAGKDTAIAGAKVLEAADTADVAARRLKEKHSKGAGARIDAVRAKANVDIAESEFKSKERDYKELQVRVSKLSLRSDIVDLKAEIKELEAETVDLAIAKSQLHGIGMEYKAQMEKENPTNEELQDRETLEVLFEDLKTKIYTLEERMNNRAEAIQLKESSLSDEALELLNSDIHADEEEYLDLVKATRKDRDNTGEAIREAREQEAKLIKELDDDASSQTHFLSRFEDSKLLSSLKDAQNVKREVLKAGSELFEERIKDAEDNLEANKAKGQDTFLSEQALIELTEAKSKVATTRAIAKTVGTLATVGSIGAEGFKVAGDALGVATDTVAKVAGKATDIKADIARFVPVTGEALHIGLHIAAGVERASGHVLSGLERTVGETLRGEIRINTEGMKAEAEMEAEATQLGLTDTDGLALSAGKRHGEVERHIAFDRVGHIMTEAGERVVEDMVGALEKAGVPVKSLGDIFGKDGLGSLFLDGMDEKGVFIGHGDYGVGLRDSIGAMFRGEDPTEPLAHLGETTVYRAAAEGFISGLFKGLNKSGLYFGTTPEEFTKALKGSRNAVKVQTDYQVAPFDLKAEEDFTGRSEVSKKLGYSHFFNQEGDREAAQRLASQKSPSIKDVFLGDKDKTEYSPDDIAHSGDRPDEGEEDYGDDSTTSMGGSGAYPENDGWLKSPYGSLIRGETRNRVGSQKSLLASIREKSSSAVQGAEGTLTKIKHKKKRRRRILLALLALFLIFVLVVTTVIIPAIMGAIGGIVTFKNSGHWGGTDCTCSCLEQFYSGGANTGGAVELGEGILSGSLENGGIITFNVPSEITQTRIKPTGVTETKIMYPQKNWAVYEFGGSHLTTHPPYDSEGLPFVIVASKLLDPETPDDSYVQGITTYGDKPVYARLLIREESGNLVAVMARVNTNDGKAHTFNTYPGKSTRYTPQEFRAAQMKTTANGVDLRPYVDEKVTYNIPSGLVQTGIAYPNSANAGGYIKYDGPWMPMNADTSTIEFNQSSALQDFRAQYPKAELLQVQTSTNKALLESLAVVEPTEGYIPPVVNPDNPDELLDPDSTYNRDDLSGTDIDPDAEIDPDEEIDPDADTNTDADTETEETPKATVPVTGPTIICDCPLDCCCWDIHGRGPNIVRSDGTPAYGMYAGRTGTGFDMATELIKNKGGYIVHENVIPGGVAVYYQNDKGKDNPKATWAGLPYDTKTIGSNGCGPSTLAIIVSTLDPDNIVNPADVAAVATQKGWASGRGHGSYHSIMWQGPAYYGLKVEPVLSNDDSWRAIDSNKYATAEFTAIMDDAKAKLIEALASNKIVFGVFDSHQRAYGAYPDVRNANVFTTGGHFLAIVGISPDHTKVYLSDPGSRARTEKEWDIDQILTGVSRGLYAVSK